MLGFLPQDIGRLRAAGDPRLSPDGSRVTFTSQRIELEANRYVTAVCVAASDGSGSIATLSATDVNAGLPRWSPDGTRIAFTARAIDDDDEGTLSEIRTIGADGGDSTIVCVCPSDPTELEWAPDGTRFAFVAREPDRARYGKPGESRKEKDMSPRKVERLFTRLDNAGWISDRPSRVFVVASDAGSVPTTVTPGAFESAGIAWAPDSRRLAFASGRHDTWDLDWAVDLWVADVDAADGSLRQVTTRGGAFGTPVWSPDGEQLACTHTGSELDGPWHGQIAVVPAAGGEAKVLSAALDRNCTPYPVPRSPIWRDGHILFLVDEGGSQHLYRVAADGNGACEPLVTGERSIGGYDAVGDTIALTVSSPRTVPELVVLAAGRETALTDLTATLTADGRTPAVAKRFTATPVDGVEVECWIIEPEHDPDVRVPLLLNIHGGPFSHYGISMFDEFQLEVAAGFGVLFCNPRGSSGYSEAWGRAIRWPECQLDPGSGWGGVDYDDIMSCVEHAVKSNDWIDPERIGVIGGSYGGYMTSWIIGHTDRFAAAVSERSCNNLLTLDHGSDIAGSFVGYVGVRHIDDVEPYLRQSPITYVHDMTTPLLILHSENDLRCPVNQAEELFVALRLLGRTPEFVRFPGESHELSRSGAPKHRVQRAELIIDFFRRTLAHPA